MMKSAYEILGLTEGATETDIKRAYRKLAFQYHPDKNSSADSHRRFIEITEAYEELTEGKIRENAYAETAENAFTSEQEEAWRNEEFRRRAAQHAELKYRQFLAETEEFKNAWYYHFGVAAHFFMMGLIFLIGATLGVAPVLFAFSVGNLFPLLLGVFTVPLAYSIFQAFFEINKRFSLFLRDDNFYQRRRKAAEEGGNSGFEKKKWPYWFPFVHFEKYKYAKFALFVPLLFAIIIPIDYLLPLKEDIQTIQETDETLHTVHTKHGTTTFTRRYFATEKLVIRGEANFGNEGDKLKLTYTPILRIVKKCQVY